LNATHRQAMPVNDRAHGPRNPSLPKSLLFGDGRGGPADLLVFLPGVDPEAEDGPTTVREPMEAATRDGAFAANLSRLVRGRI
jgi:hypothetical protein